MRKNKPAPSCAHGFHDNSRAPAADFRCHLRSVRYLLCAIYARYLDMTMAILKDGKLVVAVLRVLRVQRPLPRER